MNISVIKEYYSDYSLDFWNYALERTRYIDSNNEDALAFYGVHTKTDENSNIIDMKIIVPKIIDEFTTLVNIHEFRHAHDMYNMLGKQLNNDSSFYEELAKGEEAKYLSKKGR